MRRSLLAVAVSVSLLGSALTAFAAGATLPSSRTDVMAAAMLYQRILPMSPSGTPNQRALIAAGLAVGEPVGAGMDDMMDAFRAGRAASALRPFSDTLFKWAASHWDHDTRTKYLYDADNLFIELLIERWNGSAWGPQTQKRMTYNPQGLVTSLEVQVWFFDHWRNHGRTLYEYEHSGLMSTAIDQSWDDVNGAWINDVRKLFSYSGGLLTQTQGELWKTDHWAALYRYVYEYNSSDLLTVLTGMVPKNGIWKSAGRTVNSYDSGDLLIEEIGSIRGPSGWVFQSRKTYAYDANDMEILRSVFTYTNNAWKPIGSIQTRYENGRVVEIVQVSTFFVTSVSRWVITYDDPQLAEERIAQKLLFSLGADAGDNWLNINRTISVFEEAGLVCACPFQGDVGPRSTGGDSFVNLVDVVTLVNVVFFNGESSLQDPNCATVRGDVAPLDRCGDGVVDALDVAVLIDYTFMQGPRLCDPCGD